MKRKSKKAIIVVSIVSIILPIICKISNISLINKRIWKTLINFAFALSTIFIGCLYKVRAIRTRKEGGVLRIRLFLLIILLLCANISTLISLYKLFGKVLMAIFGIILVIGSTYIFYNGRIKKSKFDNKRKYDFNFENIKKCESIYLDCNDSNSTINIDKNVIVQNQSVSINSELNKNYDIFKVIKTSKYKTIEELWEQKDPNAKCITISNCENENLKWVKIYKNRYSDGNFYGYVKMNNAAKTVNGIIYYSDRPIWYNV